MATHTNRTRRELRKVVSGFQELGRYKSRKQASRYL